MHGLTHRCTTWTSSQLIKVAFTHTHLDLPNPYHTHHTPLINGPSRDSNDVPTVGDLTQQFFSRTDMAHQHPMLRSTLLSSISPLHLTYKPPHVHRGGECQKISGSQGCELWMCQLWIISHPPNLKSQISNPLDACCNVHPLPWSVVSSFFFFLGSKTHHLTLRLIDVVVHLCARGNKTDEWPSDSRDVSIKERERPW